MLPSSAAGPAPVSTDLVSATATVLSMSASALNTASSHSLAALMSTGPVLIDSRALLVPSPPAFGVTTAVAAVFTPAAPTLIPAAVAAPAAAEALGLPSWLLNAWMSSGGDCPLARPLGRCTRLAVALKLGSFDLAMDSWKVVAPAVLKRSTPRSMSVTDSALRA
jgi:hypothetical protein